MYVPYPNQIFTAGIFGYDKILIENDYPLSRKVSTLYSPHSRNASEWKLTTM